RLRRPPPAHRPPRPRAPVGPGRCAGRRGLPGARAAEPPPRTRGTRPRLFRGGPAAGQGVTPMTEEEWLSSIDPRPIAQVLVASPVASDRKLRLFLAAFWRWQVGNLADPIRSDLLARVGAMEVLAETGKLPKGFRRGRSRSAVFFGDAKRGTTSTTMAPFGWPD